MYAITKESVDAARKAENRTHFIDAKGAFLGEFTKAEKVLAATGTHGVSFSFKGNDGDLANFSIYTIKKDGTKLGDYGLLIAIMACMGVRDLTEAKVKSPVWNAETRQNEEQVLTQFPELLGKQIGLMFIMEEYEKKDNTGAGTGEYGWSARLNAAFRAADNLFASEIMDRKTQALKYPLILDALRDRPIKNKAGGGASLGSRRLGNSGHPNAPGAGGFDQMDDDIPF